MEGLGTQYENCIWWEPFINQLVMLGKDYELDCFSEAEFESLIKLFIKISKFN